MRVPVRHWRTLFHYLGRLDATFAEARADGRTWVNWHLREDGVIWVSEWDLTEDEQAQRGTLSDGFDRTLWTALDPDLRAERLAALGSEAVDAIVPFLYHGCTAAGPFLHRPDTGLQTRAPP